MRVLRAFTSRCHTPPRPVTGHAPTHTMAAPRQHQGHPRQHQGHQGCRGGPVLLVALFCLLPLLPCFARCRLHAPRHDVCAGAAGVAAGAA